MPRQWLIDYGLQHDRGIAGDETETFNLIVNAIEHIKAAAGLFGRARVVGVKYEHAREGIEYCMALAYNTSVQAMKLPNENNMRRLKEVLGRDPDEQPQWYERC
jgi:hypothetical protein